MIAVISGWWWWWWWWCWMPKRGRNWQNQMTRQLCNYGHAQAATTSKKNEYIVQGENILNSINFCPGHDCKSHKKCVSAVTALSRADQTNPFIAQPLNDQADLNRPTTKHFSNDIFARNYILITRRTSERSCKGMQECWGMRHLVINAASTLTPTNRWLFFCFVLKIDSENAF